MTEYEEITDGQSIESLYHELHYQIFELGYSWTDSFCDYIRELITIKETQKELSIKRTRTIINTL